MSGTFPAGGPWRESAGPLGRLRRWATFPARGTWIEINLCPDCEREERATFPARGTWIEIFKACTESDTTETFPARGTWIEISGGI